MATTAVEKTRNIPIAKPFFGVEEEEAVLKVIRSGWVSQGPLVAEFERRFAAFVGAQHAIAVSSCTTGLHLAFAVMDIHPGEEVLCPSLSFIATANSVRYAGAEPVFVDIDPLTYNLDPKKFEAALTRKTKAILAVHQIGLPADMDAINDFARRKGLQVLEDAACAIGSEYGGKRIGAPHCPMAVFSFHPRKILSTGEGGMITTNDESLAARLRKIRQHAMSVSDVARHQSSKVIMETYDEVGFNYRMTDMQAALGLVQLDRLPGFLERRRMLAHRYTQKLADVRWLSTPVEPKGSRHNFQSYMVRLLPGAPQRESLMNALLEVGIATRRGIMASHREPPYRDPKWEASLPETNTATEQCMILPLYHQMTEEDQDYVIERIVGIGARG